MEENLEIGLTMLVLGMTTVFFILFFVVAGGKLLVRFTNKFYPADLSIAGTGDDIDKKKIAAIAATVELITGGKGKVAGINKVE